jgi:ABC-type phosphate transport system auxiliary subunit
MKVPWFPWHLIGSTQTRTNTMTTKQSVYIEKMKSQLDELNVKMNTLQSKAKDAKDEARETYKAEMAKLQEQSKQAVTKLNEMKAASEDKWENMVAEMEKVRDAFTHSFNYFKSQF